MASYFILTALTSCGASLLGLEGRAFSSPDICVGSVSRVVFTATSWHSKAQGRHPRRSPWIPTLGRPHQISRDPNGVGPNATSQNTGCVERDPSNRRV